MGSRLILRFPMALCLLLLLCDSWLYASHTAGTFRPHPLSTPPMSQPPSYISCIPRVQCLDKTQGGFPTDSSETQHPLPRSSHQPRPAFDNDRAVCKAESRGLVRPADRGE